MLLKSEKKIKKKIKKKNFLSFFLITYFLITFFAGSLVTYYILTSYQFKSQIDKLLTSISKSGRYEMIYLPKILFKSLQSNFYNIDRININLSFTNELILEDYRKKITSDNELKSSQAPRVNTTIEYKEKNYPGRVRLKGDRREHWEDRATSSYKFELDDDVFFMGMNKFSIHKPVMRNYIHEWLFHQMSEELGLVAVNYKFFNVSTNGTDRGLYALEEGFGKELIERSNRRNGPIFSMNEELNENTIGNWFQDNTNLEVYNKRYWNKEENFQLLKSASDKMNNFFLGNEKVGNVFDLDKWATYLAICDLLYTYHGTYIKSVRYYYNPIIGKFEPVPFDGHRGRNHPNFNKLSKDYNNQIILDYLYNHDDNFPAEGGLEWLNLFFLNKNKKLNENFYKLYIKKLELITSDNFLNNFISNRKKEINEINSHIYNDYFLFDNLKTRGPGFYYFSIKDLQHRARTIRSKINSNINNYPEYIQAGIEGNNLIIKNYSGQDYAVLAIKELICGINNTHNLNRLDLKTKFPIINFNLNNIENSYQKLENKYVKTIINLEPLKILYLERCHSIKVENLANKENYLIKFDKINFNYSKNINKNETLQDFSDFFKIDGDNLVLKENKVIIDKNIQIPKGFLVVIKSGQQIILKNNAFIFSNSPWSAIANENKIIISGEESNFGGGIFIDTKNKKSIFKNVFFSNLNGPDDQINKELILYGTLNFHESNVELANIEFKNINSEDVVNIFRSDFNIRNLKFYNAVSDGIDFDFSFGSAENLYFENIGGDALDFSGSDVTINILNSKFVADKIVSAGEMSSIEVSNVKSTDSYSGIVSKDGSNVKITNIDLKRVQFPFAAYLKKPEYEKPSFIKVYSKHLIKNKSNFLVDRTSEILINDKRVGIYNKNVINLLNKINLQNE